MTDLNGIPTAMSTSALESKLRSLKEKSNKHSQVLTGKLATSQSGQNLLHIGTSLSTLPPDLHSLLTQLHPVLSSAESTEKQYLQHLEKLVHCGSEIRMEERRVLNAKECATLYQDLMAAEIIVKKDASCRNASLTNNTEDEDGAAGTFHSFVRSPTESCCFCSHFSICILFRKSRSHFFFGTMCPYYSLSYSGLTIQYRHDFSNDSSQRSFCRLEQCFA
jgi:hypothetical protein